MKKFKALILAKKEIKHSLKDFRVMFIIVLSTLVFYPGIMIVSAYFEDKQKENAQSSKPVIALEGNLIREIADSSINLPFEVYLKKDYEKALKNGEIEGILNINEEDKVIEYQYMENSFKSLISTEILKMWTYNFEKEQIEKYMSELKLYEKIQLYNYTFELQNQIPENQKSAFISVIPVLILIGLVAGITGIGIDTTVGEKEKRTLITLLTSNQSNTEIAIGKLLSTSFFGILTSVLTIIGCVLGSVFSNKWFGLAKLIDMELLVFLKVLLVVLSISLFLSSITLIIGIFSKSVKEANSYITPFYICIMIAAFIPSIIEDTSEIKWSLLPIMNVVISIKSILIHEEKLLFIVLSVCSTLIYTSLLIGLFIRLFKMEKYTLG